MHKDEGITTQREITSNHLRTLYFDYSSLTTNALWCKKLQRNFLLFLVML